MDDTQSVVTTTTQTGGDTPMEEVVNVNIDDRIYHCSSASQHSFHYVLLHIHASILQCFSPSCQEKSTSHASNPNHLTKQSRKEKVHSIYLDNGEPGVGTGAGKASNIYLDNGEPRVGTDQSRPQVSEA